MNSPAWLRSRWLVALLLAPVFGLQAPPVRSAEAAAVKDSEGPALKAAGALYEGIRTETLPNGLRVFLKPVPKSPVVTLMVAYKVGSADEDLDNTGLSHYLEHLMFKGTDKIKPGDIDRLTLRNGGANNAYTSEDYTVYHFDFAADRWEPALAIEADRMQNLRIDTRHEFEQEKGAVIEELQRNEDTPWDLESKAILPLLFENGPYGHPVIGQRQHVRSATAAVIKAHYDKWYHPNNAALVVSGGFDADKALTKIKELFGPIPRADLPERKPVQETRRNAPVHKQMPSKFEVPRLLMGFNTIRTGDPDYYALEVLQAILSGGKTSRLYKKLVEGEEIASDASSANYTGRYPGMFSVQVELLQGKDVKEAEKLVLAELQRLRDEPVSAAELKRVKRGVLSSAIFDRESVHSLADSIARGVTTNDMDFLKDYLPRIAAVTDKDVQEAARKYLDPERRVVVVSIPKEKTGASHGEPSGVSRRVTGHVARLNRDHLATIDKGVAGGFSLKTAKRVVLDNGMVLLLFENHRLPIVVAEAYVRQVRLHEPEDRAGITTLVGSLLDEGTAKHTGPEISEMIEDVGGALSLGGSGGSVKVLTPDRSLGLSLLFECLTTASFPKDAFARERKKLLSEIEDDEQQPDSRANKVYHKLAYGKHPYGWPSMGTRQTVSALTIPNCADFYHRLFVPNNTVVALAGDFDSKQIIEEITRLTAGWKQGSIPKVETPDVEKPGEFVQNIITMPEAAQLHFYMGHAGIRRKDPDYYKLLVMDYVLGTGPGFTDRLSARLRDRQGLAYTVSANISSSSSEEPGLFTCYIGTPPENFALVKKSFLEELNRIRDEKPQTEEVEDAKKYLLGSLPFQLTTNDRLVSELLYVERYQLGFDYLEKYQEAVKAVTPEDVQAVARKHIDPQRLVLVAAGAIDKDGKPLEKSPPAEKAGTKEKGQ